MPWHAPGSTALVVVTPEAERLIGRWYQRHSGAGRDGMSPHITLLVPFVPASLLDSDVNERLRRALASVEPFDYVLERLERWPGGILYLAPEPARPFIGLTEALVREFPAYPPYDGAHDEVIPHATVAVSEDAELLAGIADEVRPELPIACHAEAATLVERGADGRWSPRRTYPLGVE